MKQITEDYVSYETAVLLKEKGFDEPTTLMIDSDGRIRDVGYKESNKNLHWTNKTCVCFTHQMALKWLREVHKLHIYAEPYWPQGDMRNKMRWQGFIVDLNTINGDSQCCADSFEEAIENRIKFALENLI